jgi:hypothetical protein
VREDGQPGGYRWGLDRKRRLLDQEKALAQLDTHQASKNEDEP